MEHVPNARFPDCCPVRRCGPGQRNAEDQPGFGGDDKKGRVDIGAIA